MGKHLIFTYFLVCISIIEIFALDNYCGLNLVNNNKTTQFAFTNETVDTAYVLVSLKDDNQLLTIIIDGKTGESLYVDKNNSVRYSKDENCKGPIIPNVEKLLTKELVSIPDNATQINHQDGAPLLIRVLSSLINLKDLKSKQVCFGFLQRLSQMINKGRVSKGLKGTVRNLNGPLKLKRDVTRFLTISQGLNLLFSEVPEGLSQIINSGVDLDLNKTFNNVNGGMALLDILQQIGEKNDLAPLLGSVLNHHETLLKIIVKLGGNELDPVDLTFSVIDKVDMTIHGKYPLPKLIHYLLKVSSENIYGNDTEDFNNILADLSSLIDSQNKKHGNGKLLGPFTEVVRDLTHGTLVINHVNVSHIIRLWRQRDASGALRFVVEAFAHLSNNGPNFGLLFDSLLKYLNNTRTDPLILNRLIPNVALDDILNGGRNVLPSILKSVDLNNLLKNPSSASDILSRIPVLKEFHSIYGKVFNISDINKNVNVTSLVDQLKNLPTFPGGFLNPTSNLIEESENIMKNIFNSLGAAAKPSPQSSNPSTGIASDDAAGTTTPLSTNPPNEKPSSTAAPLESDDDILENRAHKNRKHNKEGKHHGKHFRHHQQDEKHFHNNV